MCNDLYVARHDEAARELELCGSRALYSRRSMIQLPRTHLRGYSHTLRIKGAGRAGHDRGRLSTMRPSSTGVTPCDPLKTHPCYVLCQICEILVNRCDPRLMQAVQGILQTTGWET
jgi:hypothetical protein